MSDDEEWVPDEEGEEEEEEHEPLVVHAKPGEDQEEREALPRETNATRPRKRKQIPRVPPPPGMIPESLIDHLLENLQGSEQVVSETLLQLARIFREQSALCLQQAERLDRMAVEQEPCGPPVFIENVSSESLSTRWRLQNVECFVEKSADLMIQCQEKLDAIETALVPWQQK